MYNSEKQIFIQETEVKPNQAAVIVLLCSMAIIVVTWLLNELGIFRVGKDIMRVGALIAIVALGAPILLVTINKKLYSDPRTKYVLMMSAIMFTITVTTLFTFHTTIIILYPIFFGMLYRSKPLGYVALAGSMFCVICTPILGYVLHSWDIDYLKELILIGTNGTAEIIGATDEITGISVLKILLYMVVPRMMIIGSCAVLMFRVISISSDHVKNEIILNRINNMDALTGLYNQNYYKKILEEQKGDGNVGVIFFDVNGLKQVNDSRGHEAGDKLLQQCAKSILAVCDNESATAFRLGGDEFLLMIEGATEPVIIQKISEWKTALEIINRDSIIENEGLICSMAAGYSCGIFDNLESLVNKADAIMYRNKAIMKKNMAAGND